MDAPQRLPGFSPVRGVNDSIVLVNAAIDLATRSEREAREEIDPDMIRRQTSVEQVIRRAAGIA